MSKFKFEIGELVGLVDSGARLYVISVRKNELLRCAVGYNLGVSKESFPVCCGVTEDRLVKIEPCECKATRSNIPGKNTDVPFMVGAFEKRIQSFEVMFNHHIDNFHSMKYGQADLSELKNKVNEIQNDFEDFGKIEEKLDGLDKEQCAFNLRLEELETSVFKLNEILTGKSNNNLEKGKVEIESRLDKFFIELQYLKDNFGSILSENRNINSRLDELEPPNKYMIDLNGLKRNTERDIKALNNKIDSKLAG